MPNAFKIKMPAGDGVPRFLGRHGVWAPAEKPYGVRGFRLGRHYFPRLALLFRRGGRLGGFGAGLGSGGGLVVGAVCRLFALGQLLGGEARLRPTLFRRLVTHGAAVLADSFRLAGLGTAFPSAYNMSVFHF